ncbi:SBBP repeat-containing protein [Arcticibacterium luteifluviistationis]|uniref:Bulb-type lectin domain-containing protein n=1 Tax=Arcticibacterium luteifluviistationis TaxID=1784714 RepID=A0A2Z4GED5_9BACT|nr:SBBP repeat-containing protein [Arcticibacterium luteifluviistationis]AWV99554.1 hypothetical protein DJ013_15815 [Arcticibacterium luteifluviistationis]
MRVYNGSRWVCTYQLPSEPIADGAFIASGGGLGQEVGTGVALDASGNVYVVGKYEGTATFGATSISSVGNEDIFIAKYNAMGTLQWLQSAGGTSDDRGHSVEVDSAGNVYVTGYYEGTATFGATSKTSAGSRDIFIAKYSTGGTLQWLQSAGGSSGDEGNSVAIDASGNVYSTGFYQGTVTFGASSKTSAGFYDVFLARISQ